MPRLQWRLRTSRRAVGVSYASEQRSRLRLGGGRHAPQRVCLSALHQRLTLRGAGGSSAAPQFVTEAELEELKAQRGGTVEDGTLSVDKPLYEVLRENKEKKAREHENAAARAS